MKSEVYCDESRQDISPNSTSKNMLIGGIWIPVERRESIKNFIKVLKEKHSIGGELKWNKIAARNHKLYMEIVDLFFNDPDIRFRCIVVDKSKLNFEKYHRGDKELGFYKFYYHMLTKWIDDKTIRIFTDLKTNRVKGRLKKLEEIFVRENNSTQIKVQAISSHESLLIQMTDILLGAISAKFNPETLINSFKNDIIKIIEKRSGKPIAATYPSEKKLNIFIINLREVGL